MRLPYPDIQALKSLYKKQLFEHFLINKEIVVNNLKTPSNTIIRYLKKCKDLGIKPVKETLDMVYVFLKHYKNMYVSESYRFFKEKTYKKFKLNKNVLEKYFIVKETKLVEYVGIFLIP